MSELKADRTFVFGEECEAYKKYEADKVIAEKDKELRHHKYKRCLAMAWWCKSNVLYYEQRIDKCWSDGNASMHKEFYQRWYKRWLELAEKFKEAK